MPHVSVRPTSRCCRPTVSDAVVANISEETAAITPTNLLIYVFNYVSYSFMRGPGVTTPMDMTTCC